MESSKDFLKSLKTTDDGKYIIKLSKPVKHGDEFVNQLEAEEPKAKHIRKFPQDPTTDDILKMIGKLTAQPDSVIDELSLKDVEVCSMFIEAFN